MFKTRLISGIFLVLIAIFALKTGGGVLFGILLALSLIGMMELYRTLNVHKTFLAAAGYVAGVMYYVLLLKGQMADFPVLVMGLILVLMSIYVFSYPKFKAQEVMCVFFGVFYVAVMLSYIYQTRCLPGGRFLVWLVFISSWGCDTSAYCAGMLFGKHKMAPVLSPKKSVEGAIGGVCGAALIGALFALGVNKVQNTGFSPAHFALIGAVCGAISMVGDLSASAIKRNHGIKDYGKLIPGHGGVLDRFDSVIFTAPLIYYLVRQLVL